MTAAAAKTVREGSASKRAAILTAARELFLAEGFDRSSVDAVSARAQVSKRTVYDYFGDKRGLLLAVVEQSAEALIDEVRAAAAEELSVDRDLETALLTFTARIATTTFGSSDYAALLRLVSSESAHLPALGAHRLATAPEEAIAERLAEFGRAGLLDVPDPLLAADHFVALTFLLAQNKLGGPLEPGMPEAGEVLAQGVRAFLRAYAPVVRG